MKLKSVILLITLLFVVNTHGQNEQQNPTETVYGFWNLVLENKSDEAINAFTAKSLVDEKLLRAEIQKIKINQSKIISITTNEEINGIIAEMNLETEDKEGKKTAYSIQFLKEKNTKKWKIIFLFRKFVQLKQVENNFPRPLKNITPTNYPINYPVNCVKCV